MPKVMQEFVLNRKQQEVSEGTKVSKRRRFERRLQYIVIGLLGVAVLVIATISAIHITRWFAIGDDSLYANITAGAFEFLILASLFSIVELQRLPEFVVFLIWCVILTLVTMQVIGNAFHVLVYINSHPGLIEDAGRLFGAEVTDGFKRSIAFALGAPLPIMSAFFMKIVASYWMLTKGINVKKKGR